MRLRAVVFVLLTALCLPCANAWAGNLKVHYTDDLIVKDSKPPQHWDTADDSGKITLNLNNGDKLWFSFLNTEDNAKKKYFTMKFSSTHLSTNVAETDGFDVDLVFGPTTIKKKYIPEGSGISQGVRTIRYRFSPQPKWERIGLKAIADIDSLEYTVKAWSVCADARPDWPELKVDAAKFGTPTEGAEDPSHIKDMWWFPFLHPVDPFIIPTMVAPPETGDWNYEFVDADPYGNPRPLGGVRFFTDGPGLTHDDEFSLSYGAHNADEVDPEHELFAWDEDAQQWEEFTIDISPDPPADVPTLSEWAMIVLTLVMMTVAVFYLRRRRQNTA